jgi:hypothetical protein
MDDAWAAKLERLKIDDPKSLCTCPNCHATWLSYGVGRISRV